MRLRAEVRLAVGALLGLQLLTSFGAVALLARMAPAVRQIIEENNTSVHAATEMVAAVALAPDDPDGQAERFGLALESARANVTEPAEAPLLDAIEADGPRALAGERGAVRRVVGALTELGAVNQEAIVRADASAQRLGAAGAWAAVLMGLLGFTAGVGVSRRLARRIETPIAELEEVLTAWRDGDLLRRCAPSEGPEDLATIAAQLNRLADRRDVRAGVPSLVTDLDRVALLALMDHTPGPVAVFDADGGLIATNPAADELLDGADALRRALGDAAGPVPGGWRRHALPEPRGLLCVAAAEG